MLRKLKNRQITAIAKIRENILVHIKKSNKKLNMLNVKEEKKRLIKEITPVGLVPMATAMAFLILGSRGEDTCKGHPSLPTFLLLAGTLTIGLGILFKIGKFVIIKGFPVKDREFTREENHVIWLLLHLRHFLSFTQVIILIVGTIIIAPLASTLHPWDYANPEAKYYCDYGTVIFSAIFFPGMWFLLILTAMGYVVIKCSLPEPGNTARNEEKALA